MAKSVFFQECLVLDPCCIINLYASGQLQAILESLPIPVVITNSVYQNSYRIYGSSDDIEVIDLHTMVQNKLLFVISLDEVINDRAANFTHISMIDDEEAITNAVAVQYNWSLGTDNLQSIALLKTQVPTIQLFSTFDILKHWIDIAHLSLSVLETALITIQRRALYTPHPIPSLYK